MATEHTPPAPVPARGKPIRPAAWLAAMLLVFGATGSRADVVKDPASGCGVHASGYLGNSEFTFQYTGACQDGLAHGNGQATWVSKYADSAKTVWKGRFSQGVYQPEPLPQAAGKSVRGTQVLFDLGPVKSDASIAAARLHVASSHHMREPASACRPGMLYLTAPSEAALGQDDAVQALIRDAMRDLAARCGKQLDVNDRHSGLRVDLLPHEALAVDRYGNLPNASVRASVSTDGQATLTGYTNQVSHRTRQAQANSVQQTQREATQARLASFFKQHGAQAWMPLTTVSQNPFRFKDQVLVTAAKLAEVESPTSARMVPLNGWPQVRVDGAAVAQWEPGSYLLAFKTVGRETVGKRQGDALLALVGFERCTAPDCSDWLDLPRPMQPGGRP